MFRNIKKIVFSIFPGAMLLFMACGCEVSTRSGKLSDEVADQVMCHCVRVKVFAKKDEGEEPSGRNLAQDLREERATLWGGYLWDEHTVVIPDRVLHDRFIRRIEVEANGKTVCATVKGYLVKPACMFLALSTPLPGVKPIRFAAVPERKDWGKLRTVAYSWDEGRWVLGLGQAVGGYTRAAKNKDFLFGHFSGLLIAPEGEIVGIAFSGRMSDHGDEYPWKGEELRKLPILTLEEKRDKLEVIRGKLNRAALPVKFTFRSEVEEDEGSRWSSVVSSDGGENEEATEVTAAGFLVSPRRLLVPIKLSAKKIAKIENISVSLQNKNSRQERVCRFLGAYKDFHTILVEVKGKPLQGALEIDTGREFVPGEMFLKANIDYSLKKRKERFTYDRCRGFFRTYRDRPGVYTFTNEDDGSIAFSMDGKVIGLSLAHRPKPTGEQYRYYQRDSNSMFRPMRMVAEILANAKAIDPTIKPLAKEQEKRIVVLGVEWQKLDKNLARNFKVEKQTRGGKIGLLVIWVYPGSPAAKIGIRPDDILLRLKSADRAEPIELKSGYGMDQFYYRSFRRMNNNSGLMGLGRGGSPWPSRNNSLTRLLSEIGDGKTVTLTYLRAGKEISATFVTTKSMPDFRAAAKYKSKKLGLTVKAVTYEVKRFFRRKDFSSVVVSKVEPGSKAAVARISTGMLITHINQQPIKDLADFKRRIKTVESGKGRSVEFTLWFMGRTRIVKIEL